MTEWPLHITLADVFAIDLLESDIERRLFQLLKKFSVVRTHAKNEATLGTTEVVLLEKNSELLELHESLINLLEAEGARFNTPEFTREGFMPHCTIQKNDRLRTGDEVSIGMVSLIDMFPSKNWQRRKIISTFKLR